MRCCFAVQERKSMRLKVILFVINVASFAMAVYFFMRHSRYCEAGGRSEQHQANSLADTTHTHMTNTMQIRRSHLYNFFFNIPVYAYNLCYMLVQGGFC